jgi:NADPH:quinone reductase-like Zn-dependent oxidoreductase
VQLAVEAGARVIGTGRAASRETALGLGAEDFIDLGRDRLEALDKVDMVFDVVGGQVLCRSAALVRPGGVLLSIAEPPPNPPDNILSVFFVVEPDRAGLAELELRLRDGRLHPLVGTIWSLDGPPRHSNRPAGVAVRPSSESSTLFQVADCFYAMKGAL